ncbi:MAG: helix-turn-helix transcriptional regulator [Lachnospiraceae bacterium]
MKIDRLLEIIIIMLNNDIITGKQLAQRFEVSIKTIQRDITTLTMAGIPIVAHTGANGGYSILESYKLKNNFIKKEDLSLITMALTSLSTSYDSNRLSQILEKYMSVSGNNKPKIYLDYGVTKEGSKIQKYNKVLENCIENRKQISFRYKNVSGKESKRVINPLVLHFKWYSWYLFAFDIDKQDYRTFKVVRMENLVTTNYTFDEIPNVYELLYEKEQEYYKNCEHIIVWCPNENIGLLEENFPDANFLQQEDGSWIMDLCVPLKEKMWQALLIGLGNSIKILAPLHYRNMLISIAKNFINNYDI